MASKAEEFFEALHTVQSTSTCPSCKATEMARPYRHITGQCAWELFCQCGESFQSSPRGTYYKDLKAIGHRLPDDHD